MPICNPDAQLPREIGRNRKKTWVTREVELGGIAIVVIDDAQDAATADDADWLLCWLRYWCLLPDNLLRYPCTSRVIRATGEVGGGGGCQAR